MSTMERPVRVLLALGLSLACARAGIALADDGMDGYRRSWHPSPAPPCVTPPCAPAEAPPVYVPPPCPPPSPPPAPPRPPPMPPPCPPAYVPPPTPPCEPEIPATAPCRWVFTPRASAWWTVPAGDHVKITLGGQPGSGTRVDTDTDMDLGAGLAWQAGLDATYDRHRIRAAYESLSVDGKNTLARDVVFHGVTFEAGEEVKSTLDLTFWKASWDYRLMGTNETGLRAGVGAWVWTFDASMEGSRDPKTSRDFTHAYPVATVDAFARFDRWTVGGSVAFGFLQSDRYLVDAEAHAGVRLTDRLEVDVGYRFLKFLFHESTNEGDLLFDGPYVGISYDI